MTPLTVKNARGYFASTFIYGTYGGQEVLGRTSSRDAAHRPLLWSQQWEERWPCPAYLTILKRAPARCSARRIAKLLADLLALRSETTRFATQKWPGFAPPNAATLNARNQHLLDQAARLLGPEKFTAIFGFAPDQKIDLVDPNIQQGQQ